MERNVSLEEISDGKRYEGNDLVKADCGDCEGCSACCQGMGSSILLDPYDIKRMEEGLCMDFNQLMAGHIELNVVDHVILPNLKMTGSGERCSFLDGHGRCSIHPYRPGFAGCFHWEGYTRTVPSGIFCRSTNVPGRTGPRSRYASGWIHRTSSPMNGLWRTGIISSRTWESG